MCEVQEVGKFFCPVIETESHLKGVFMESLANEPGGIGEEENISSLASSANLVIHSSDLFGEKKLVLIKHRSDWYRLMLTKQGKLILTK